MQEILLASASPRRRELMELLPYPFTVCAMPTQEIIDAALSPEQNVMQLARQKAAAVAKAHPQHIVIGCDTIVVAGGAILGKPTDAADARRMLQALSGREHHVYTGVCVAHAQGQSLFFEATRVKMKPLTEQELSWYLATDEPFDKAGAYGIQGRAALFIEGIEGDYYNVVGLPVCRLYAELERIARLG